MCESLKNEYFMWIFDIISHDRYSVNTKYSALLEHLFAINFTWLIDMDENRAKDGLSLRHKFGDENEYRLEFIDQELGHLPCSVLEMMVALAYRCEDSIMGDERFGDRTGYWFWGMVVSLDLGMMTNRKYDPIYVDGVINRFLDRQFEPNGDGSLFTTKDPNKDFRNVEIWYQMMDYLNSYLDDSPGC